MTLSNFSIVYDTPLFLLSQTINGIDSRSVHVLHGVSVHSKDVQVSRKEVRSSTEQFARA